MKRILAVLLLVFFSVALSACVPGLGTRSRVPATGEFVKGKVAPGFPENLPLPEGAETIESYGSSEAFGASFISGQDPARVVNFYSSALPRLGWDSTLNKQSERNYEFAIRDDTYVGVVIVNTASDGKKTAITIAVESR
ncbi:hypothetical protein HYZ70_02930 [Candidatus Curtissbacteria bacterium]|nr:hypothetical protein [Candidatus Curtissbacteria bacterium]